MSDVPDLSQLSANQQQRIEQLAESHPEDQPKHEVITAFLVYQTLDGQWIATSNYVEAELLDTARPATGDDMVAACAVIENDIQAVKSAQHYQRLAIQTARALQEQQRAQQLASKLDLSKLRT